MAEIELSALSRQCLDRRIADSGDPDQHLVGAECGDVELGRAQVPRAVQHRRAGSGGQGGLGAGGGGAVAAGTRADEHGELSDAAGPVVAGRLLRGGG